MKEESSAKLKILETASRLFQKQGYHATGLNQILHESGAPKGSLYYYYPGGKEELAVDAIHFTRDTIGKKIKAFLSKIDDPVDAIQALVLATANEAEDANHITPCTVSLLTLETSLISEPLRKACLETNEAWEEIFSQKLIMGGYDKESAGELGTLIQIMIDGALISSISRNDTQPLHYFAKQIPSFLRKERSKK